MLKLNIYSISFAANKTIFSINTVILILSFPEINVKSKIILTAEYS